MPKEKNVNLTTFVDQVTPEPKIILENYIDFEKLSDYQSTYSANKELLDQLVDVILSCNKQEEFISFGERVALNTLRKLQILV